LALGEPPHFEVLNFLRRRVTRLAPPLVFALVVTYLLDSTGSLAHARRYDASSSGRRASAFVMNAVFLQGFAAPTFGSNSALWSLSYEAVFYLCYPLFL